MNAEQKRKLKNEYRSQPATGGVCGIRCTGNQRVRLLSTGNIEGLKNRFAFSMKTGTCPDPALRKEYAQYGPEAFEFVVLEELKREDDQTDGEYAHDIGILYELWQDKARRSQL